MIGTEVTDVAVKTETAFESRWNVAQGALHVGISLLLIAACLGVFGHGGPFSTAKLRAPGTGIELTYDRFLRNGAPGSLVVRLPTQVPGGLVRVRVGRPFLDRIDIADTSPRPETTESGAAGVAYTFRVAPHMPGPIKMSLRPVSFGILHDTIGVADADLALTQIVWP